MTDLELAKATRARLLEFGHTTRGYGTSRGPNCVMGAALRVAGVSSRRAGTTEFRSIHSALRRILDSESVMMFNDEHPERIIPLLDAFIAQAEVTTEELVFA